MFFPALLSNLKRNCDVIKSDVIKQQTLVYEAKSKNSDTILAALP